MTLRSLIDQAQTTRGQLSATSAPPEVRAAVEQTIAQLDAGTLRVAEKRAGEWVVHQWVKKAVLLSFRLNDNGRSRAASASFMTRCRTSSPPLGQCAFARSGVRVVPPAVARRGAFVAEERRADAVVRQYRRVCG